MIILPAIDLMEGKCVRLYQGRLESVKIYYENPEDAARKWESEGAQYLHVVDLNGAVAGKPQNLETVEKIVKTVKIPIQFGGGIRDISTLEKVLDLGVERIVLGTTIITSPEFVAEACYNFGSKIVAAVDASGGRVHISGWRDGTDYSAIEIIKELKILGVKRLVYTDIFTDGTLRGVNIDAIKQILEKIDLPVIVSGGVSSLDDIKKLKALEPRGIEGIIIGTALYQGAINLKEAIEAAK